MASIHREISIHANADHVWDIIRDIGEVHRRFVPGLVTDVRLETGARVVTFSNGMVVREIIVDLDNERRRFAYAAVSEGFHHHNASMQVFPDGPDRCRFVWITDSVPEPQAMVARIQSPAAETSAELAEFPATNGPHPSSGSGN